MHYVYTDKLFLHFQFVSFDMEIAQVINKVDRVVTRTIKYLSFMNPNLNPSL